MSNTTKINIYVRLREQTDDIEGAFVTAWLFNSQTNDWVKVSGETETHETGQNPYFQIKKYNFDYDYYIVHAFYSGNSNISDAHITFTPNITNTQTIYISGGGYYFSLSAKYNSFDTLFYYIGTLAEVYPYNMEVTDSNVPPTTVFATYNNVSSTSSITNPCTGMCSTRFLYLKITPTGVASNYDSTIKVIDLFGYIGGNISSYEILIPRKEYMLETPLVYDTIMPASDDIIGYNLPNTNIHLHFYAWNPQCDYAYYTTSNVSAMTIVNSNIHNTWPNNDWFYRCLAGRDVPYQSCVKYEISKHHYSDIGNSGLFTVSALTSISTTGHPIPYTLTSNTIDYLYVCSNNPNGNNGNITISNDRTKVYRLFREKDAVFRRQEVEDYVRGFGYTYYGHFYDHNVNRSQYGFDTFSLPPVEKTPPSKQYFYEDATSGLSGTVFSNDLEGFKTNFINLLTTDIFFTKYTEPNSLEYRYTNDNSHCYVMDETIIPNQSEQDDYFYFYNGCSEPKKFQQAIDEYGEDAINNMNTAVGIRLETYGTPDAIQLQYSYNGAPWTNYEIGHELILLKSHTLYFKARFINSNFSLNERNYYYFVVNNTYYNENSSLTYENLIEEYCKVGNNTFNINLITNENGISYNVMVGGKISSLLNANNNGWENSQLNDYGFTKLFEHCKITSCKRGNTANDFLKLDLRSCPSYGYQYMFYDTRYLKIGPSIYATSVGTYAMQNMFDTSSLTELVDNTLYFYTPASYCCYRMFQYSDYNKSLEIVCSSEGNEGVSFFEKMFYCGLGTFTCVNFLNMKIFPSYSCTRMFYNSNTTKFSKFPTVNGIENIIFDIGDSAFYEMYRYSCITSVSFTVTNSVYYKGCMYMCANLNINYCDISNMHLDANNLSTECYAYMFYDSTCAAGTFYFDKVDNISESGCIYMFYSAGVSGYANNLKGIICHCLSPIYLNNACYSHMFEKAYFSEEPQHYGPELPAVNLYEECYSWMFHKSNITMNYGQEIPSFDTLYVPKNYVLNATSLPKKCYYNMYSWSTMQHPSNVITTALTTAGEQSCGYMFSSTPIAIENRKRKIQRNDGYDMTFRVVNGYLFNGLIQNYMHAVCTKGLKWNEDTFMHVGEDIFLDSYSDNSETKVCLLTSMSAHLNSQLIIYNDPNFPSHNLSMPSGDYLFIDKTLTFWESEVNYNGHERMTINGNEYEAFQTIGEHMAMESGRIWFMRETKVNNGDKLCISLKDKSNNENAFYLLCVRGYFENELNFPSGFLPYIWYKIPRNTFNFDRRKFTVLGTYATYSYQENINPYLLSANYEIKGIANPNFVYAQCNFTYNYVSGSEIVNLNATTLSDNCYEYMFSCCYNLYFGHNFRFGELRNLSNKCFSHMFSGCTNLRTITPDFENFTTLANYCYEYMYANCSHHVDWEDEYFIFHRWDFSDIGLLDKGLDRICNPNEIYTKYDSWQNNNHTYGSNNDVVSGKSPQEDTIECQYMPNVNAPFWNQNGLYTNPVPEDREYYNFTQDLQEGCYLYMFKDCYSLQTAKINLIKNIVPSYAYMGMFRSCINLINGPTISSSLSTVGHQGMHSMFEGCTTFSGTINSNHTLNAMNLDTACYASMFHGCGSMSAAPYLPATTMASECYNNMFNSAVEYEFVIEEHAQIVAVNSEGNTTTLHIYYGVSGTNRSAGIFHTVQSILSRRPVIITDTMDDIIETQDVDFEVGGSKSVCGNWYNPDCLYFYQNFDNVKSIVADYLNNLILTHFLYIGIGVHSGHYNVISCTTRNFTNNTTRKINKGLKYIKAKISKNNLLSQNYTYQWVEELEHINNGEYHGPAYNITEEQKGGSTIPEGWSTYSS